LDLSSILWNLWMFAGFVMMLLIGAFVLVAAGICARSQIAGDWSRQSAEALLAYASTRASSRAGALRPEHRDRLNRKVAKSAQGVEPIFDDRQRVAVLFVLMGLRATPRDQEALARFAEMRLAGAVAAAAKRCDNVHGLDTVIRVWDRVMFHHEVLSIVAGLRVTAPRAARNLGRITAHDAGTFATAGLVISAVLWYPLYGRLAAQGQISLDWVTYVGGWTATTALFGLVYSMMRSLLEMRRSVMRGHSRIDKRKTLPVLFLGLLVIYMASTFFGWFQVIQENLSHAAEGSLESIDAHLLSGVFLGATSLYVLIQAIRRLANVRRVHPGHPRVSQIGWSIGQAGGAVMLATLSFSMITGANLDILIPTTYTLMIVVLASAPVWGYGELLEMRDRMSEMRPKDRAAVLGSFRPKRLRAILVVFLGCLLSDAVVSSRFPPNPISAILQVAYFVAFLMLLWQSVKFYRFWNRLNDFV
jgi:hypothetical protein